MLIEVKEPSAVIPLVEYERLKKIEDKYADNIEEIRMLYEKRFDDALVKMMDDSESKVVVLSLDNPGYAKSSYLARRMSNEEYDKYLHKDRATVSRVVSPEDGKSLYERIFGKPFNKQY